MFSSCRCADLVVRHGERQVGVLDVKKRKSKLKRDQKVRERSGVTKCGVRGASPLDGG